ncbi:hypothetical protein Cni_G11948 [Canna indica]|uniref:MADS-box domain-containing protein n=1 Tax=Canna indica TaxID=4628 RepID=A0AAQ3K6Y5_9LILI|nr:hypothetical protein Cni_G11948 [Canna indica]
MARNKVKLAWIANDATRRATLKKRRKGLIKKVQELSILCGVEACVVVYAPQEHEPVAWPSLADAGRMMARFMSLPEIERNRKMVNQEMFLRQRIAKLQEQLRRQQRENREIEITALLFEGLRGRSLHDLSIEDASALAWMVDTKLRAIYEKREELAKRVPVAPPPPQQSPLQMSIGPPTTYAAAGMSMQAATMERMNPMGAAPVDGSVVQKPNWFLDMMNPWPVAPPEEGGHVFGGDQGVNAWADMFH